MDLGLELRTHAGIPVIGLQGELDVHGAPKLRDSLFELMAEGHQRIVLDFSALEFIDSSGLGVILGALRRQRDHGGQLVVACATPRIVRLLEITGLSDVMSLRDSVEDAAS